MEDILDSYIIDQIEKEKNEVNNENVIQIHIKDLNELKYFHYLESLKKKKDIKEEKRVIEIEI